MEIQTEMSQEDFCEVMTHHLERLGIIAGCFSLFYGCAEGNLYRDSKSEIWALGLVLEEYIKNTKKKFMDYAQDINALH